MKRNKILTAASIAALFAVAVGTAHADINAVSNDKINVDFYGVLDVAYGTVQHSLGINSQYSQSINAVSPTPIKASAAGTSAGTQAPSTVSGLFNGGLQDPRFGFKGSLDLGNGWNAFFTLEEGVNLTTGQVNNSAAALAQNGGGRTG